MVRICPSILSADFLNLKEEIKLLEKAKIEVLHFDVMDGYFVPNLSFGPSILSSIKKVSKMLMDVHLMVKKPLKFLEQFSKAGAFSITFHVECDDNILECINKIKSLNCKCGIAINPKTSIEKIFPFLDYVDMVVVISVNPGFGGQEFIKDSLKKVKDLKLLKSSLKIQLDGGINLKTAKYVSDASVSYAVVGSYIFSSGDVLNAISNLNNILTNKILT